MHEGTPSEQVAPTPFDQGLGQPSAPEHAQEPATAEGQASTEQADHTFVHIPVLVESHPDAVHEAEPQPDRAEPEVAMPEIAPPEDPQDQPGAGEPTGPTTPEQPQPGTTGEMQPGSAEQEQPLDRVAKIAEFNSLFKRVEKIVAAGHTGSAESPEGSLISNFKEGPISITYKNTVSGVRNESMVSLGADELTIDRTVKTDKGQKTLSVTLGKSGNKGTLYRRGPDMSRASESVELTGDHIRDVVETVMSQLQIATGAKELVVNAIDEEVKEILGLELTEV